MNIVQLHERVKFWTDTVGSARFEESDIDNSLNLTQNSIVEDRYESTKKMKGDSFQKTQKIRDELSNIVIEIHSGVEEGDLAISHSVGIPVGEETKWTRILAASIPVNYKYLLAVAIVDGTTSKVRHNCWPLTYDRFNVINKNPYRKVRITPDVKCYYIESSLGITIYHLLADTPERVDVYYMSKPDIWKWGIEKTTTDTLIEGQVLIVTSDSAMYEGVRYYFGDEITVIGGVPNMTAGTGIVNSLQSNINTQLYEELARKAAVNLMLSSKEFDKAKALTEFFMI